MALDPKKVTEQLQRALRAELNSVLVGKRISKVTEASIKSHIQSLGHKVNAVKINGNQLDVDVQLRGQTFDHIVIDEFGIFRSARDIKEEELIKDTKMGGLLYGKS